MIIWTYIKRPFTMGGRVWRPTGCEVAVGDKLDLGKEFYGYVVISPKGKTLIVEEKSGAIVGSSLDEVRKDIATADMAVMEEQVSHAMKERGLVEVIEEAEFWRIYDNIK